MDIPNQYTKNLYKAILAFLVILSLFFVVKLLSEWRAYGMMGSGSSNTITLSGYGEVQAVPDIANISFTISKNAKTVKEAQNEVAKVEKSSLEFLRKNDIAEKDIKTTNSSFYPKYEYRYDSKLVPCDEYRCPPQQGRRVVVGYTVNESITVKIRKTDDTGMITQGLGDLGITNLNGPNFTIDDEDGLKAEARKKAIDDAQKKAKVLAKDLGVSLGRITSFNERGNYSTPILYKAISLDFVQNESAPAELPKGENTISSSVTITYEIK